jgi:hypothetical protein
MTDRRALIVGSWQVQGGPSHPSPQRVIALTSRWKAVCKAHAFNGLSTPGKPAEIFHNPILSDLIEHTENAESVGDETELLLYFVGHSTRLGDDDLEIILGVDKSGENRRASLKMLLELIRTNARVRRMVVVLDTCHAGHAEEHLFSLRNTQLLALLATGDGYAFNADFSEGVLRALEEPLHKSDQRIDRVSGGMTYRKVFEFARKYVLTRTSRGRTQSPLLIGAYDDLLVSAPVNVPVHFHPFASDRSIYGRLFRIISILAETNLNERRLLERIRSDDVFLLKRGEDGQHESVSPVRLTEYLDFLRAAKWVVQPDSVYRLTEQGRLASRTADFNKRLLAVIEANVLPEDIKLDRLDQILDELLLDAIPTTPIKIRERAAMNGWVLDLTSPVRVALQLLPSTGRFTKGSADALYPAELGG